MNFPVDDANKMLSRTIHTGKVNE